MVKGDKGGLGRSIIRDRFGSTKGSRTSATVSNHIADLERERAKTRNLKSTLEQNDLTQLLEMATLADRDFTAEKSNVVLINAATGLPYGKSRTNHDGLSSEQLKKYGTMKIPRRPPWDESTTPEELEQNEKEAFLEWRRELADIEEEDGLTLTPFEKNLEVWRQLWRVVERSDIIVQIVDARNPLLFHSEDLFAYVKEVDKTKRCLLLVNKADLLTDDQRNKWATYFDQHNINALFFSANNEQLKQGHDIQDEVVDDLDTPSDMPVASSPPDSTSTENSSLNTLHSSEGTVSESAHVYDRDGLLEKIMGSITKRPLMIGMVGYPNVGKSSTINVLLGEKHVAVSATPGKTKHFQTLRLTEDVSLCDCPGLVFPTVAHSKGELICNGILPIDHLREHRSAVELVCRTIPRSVLESTYGIILPLPDVSKAEDASRPPRAEEVLQAYGHIRGFFTTHGLPDESRAARIILKDYVKGKLLHCVLPPGVSEAQAPSKSEIHSSNDAHPSPSPISTPPPSNPIASQKRPKATAAKYNEDEETFFKRQASVVARTMGRQNGGSPFTRVQPAYRGSEGK